MVHGCSPLFLIVVVAKRPAPGAGLIVWLAIASVLDLRRQLAAIGGELAHHLLVQPDVHAGGIIGVAGVAELLGKLLARREAGVDVERLHQVDDGVLPVELLALGGDGLVEDGSDIDRLRRRGRGCGAAAGRRTARRCRASLAEDRVHDRSENTHRSLPINLKMPWGFVALSWFSGSTLAGGSQINSTLPPTGLPMRQSPKLEQDSGHNWEYHLISSSRHGQFSFLSRLV